MALVPTMKIQDGQGGFIVINKEDFKPEIHEPFEVESKKAYEGGSTEGDPGEKSAAGKSKKATKDEKGGEGS